MLLFWSKPTVKLGVCLVFFKWSHIPLWLNMKETMLVTDFNSRYGGSGKNWGCSKKNGQPFSLLDMVTSHHSHNQYQTHSSCSETKELNSKTNFHWGKKKLSYLPVLCWGETKFFISMRDVLLTKIKPSKKIKVSLHYIKACCLYMAEANCTNFVFQRFVAGCSAPVNPLTSKSDHCLISLHCNTAQSRPQSIKVSVNY